MSGGDSPSNVTQTNVTQLPSWLNNANTFGAQQAANLYNTGGPAYYPGNTVAPFSPLQEEYFTGVQNAAANGDPNANAGANFVQGQLAGEYANPASNPYLQSTFANAADAVQNQLGTEFAGAGRNPQASIGAQADQMNQLANDIYGGQYDEGMNQMMQAAQLAPAYNSMDLQNLANLGAAGSQLQEQSQNMINANQNLYDYYAQLPYTNLGTYMGTVNSLAHGGSDSATTPYFGPSKATQAVSTGLAGAGLGGVIGGAMGSAAAGASTGAAAGMGVFSPEGALIGGGLGLLAGWL